jgi:[protein-PII] uridylyltransferase
VTPAARLDTARGEFAAQIARGHGGREAASTYTAQVDAVIRQIVAAAAPGAGRCAVTAIGGYGRRQLCLHSDIDLLVIFGGSIGAADERLVRALLHPLWDLGLTVGHQIREADEFACLEADNPEFLLAFADARLVDGDPTLLSAAQAAFDTPATRACAVAALHRLIEERHARFNSTLYQLEPDVKDAPGGLRDVAATRLIARLTDPALSRQGPEDATRLDDAEDFLLRIRSILHLDAQRNHNVLTHALQETAAEMLKYPGSAAHSRVERFMSDYFRDARVVSRSLEWMRRTAPAPAGPNLVASPDGIRFVDGRQAAIQPATWLGAFEAAIDRGCAVSDSALVSIRAHAPHFGFDDYLPTATERQDFVRFLTPRAGLYARLSEMHDCGLLGRLVPPFHGIACRVVRDFYHKYTVDEHTLLAIRNLEVLLSPPSGRERFAALLQEIHAPELLVLALLLHDVGKGRGTDHAAESVRLAQDVLDRLELAPPARDLVEFLIAQHLRLAQVAFRRDTEDPQIVADFAALVGDEQRLKMLCLMTVADIQAVSLETLTPWKEELIWRLYVDTYNHLTLAYGEERIDGQLPLMSAIVANRAADISAAEISAFVEGLPRRYLQAFEPDAVYRHVRLAREIHPDEVHVSLEPKRGIWELTVVTLDKPFLFSNISGVLASFGMDILRGQAMTNPNGLVLDVFQFADQERFLELNQDAPARIGGVLNDVVAGRRNVGSLLAGREAGLFARRPARCVRVAHGDNELSARYTILDIVADNAVGLLHRISRVISEHGCNVELVLISTEGHKAIDVFHLTRAGAKLSTTDMLALTADVQRTLEALA